MNQPARATTIALLAMGGEGGGVLADWLVALAEHNGFIAQATSVPGVAQRTGATIYYLELFPQGEVPAGAQPVLGLGPVPGEMDIVIASELMEAGRALQRGLVSSDRTVFIASTHRVYTNTERTAMGDGRVDSGKIMEGARAAARQFVAADFGRIAEQCGSPISAVLYGALCASGALPFSRPQFEETIRRSGLGVESSLAAFAAGAAAASGGSPGESAATERLPSTGPRLAGLARRIERDFPPAVHATLRIGIVRLADYQDIAYAGEYLDRLACLRTADPELLGETARHLALWMSYEDTIRVADLKIRRSRFERVAGEVKLQAGQQLGINEYFHPRLEEIADTLPAPVGRWLLATPWARARVLPLTRRGRVVRTSAVGGYLMLYMVAALRRIRRKTLRFQTETRHMAQWLDTIHGLSASHPGLALEVARVQRLVKGYGETHERGRRNFQLLMTLVPRLQAAPDGAQRLGQLIRAALADESGQELHRLIEPA